MSNDRFQALFWLTGLAVVAAGCSPTVTPSGVNTADAIPVSIVSGEEPTQEQKDRMLAAKEALFSKLSSRLTEVMGKSGPAAAITVCQQEASKIASEVSAERGLQIGRTGVRLRNPNNLAPEWARSLIEAKSDAPTFAKLSNGHAAALLPIKLQGQCLMCHGPKEQVTSIIQDQLTRLYPNDQATGFKEGELRGWFWIDLPSNEASTHSIP
jgi:Protein of unknown function (DUF3365)